MLGDEKVINRLKNLWSDSNPFTDFNARVLLDDDTSWDKKKGLSEAKSKLLFQEHRFGIPKQKEKENEIAITIDGKTRYLKEKIISIGRSSTNTVVLNDNSISRRHCAIVNYNKDVWIYDLTSTIGTFLEGKRIVGKRFLLGVYNIQIGNIQLRISSQADLLI